MSDEPSKKSKIVDVVMPKRFEWIGFPSSAFRRVGERFIDLKASVGELKELNDALMEDARERREYFKKTSPKELFEYFVVHDGEGNLRDKPLTNAQLDEQKAELERNYVRWLFAFWALVFAAIGAWFLQSSFVMVICLSVAFFIAQSVIKIALRIEQLNERSLFSLGDFAKKTWYFLRVFV
jgi:hypothetical protein